MNVPQALAARRHAARRASRGARLCDQPRAASTSRTANKMLVMIDGRTVYSPVSSPACSGKRRTWSSPTSIASRWCAGLAARCGAPMRSTASSTSSPRAPPTRAARSSMSPPAPKRSGPSRSAMAGVSAPPARIASMPRCAPRTPAELLSGGSAGNEHDFGQAGFRIESDRSGNNFAFLQGDTFAGDTGLGVDHDRVIAWRGGNLLARWTGRADSGAETTLQALLRSFLSARTRPVSRRAAHAGSRRPASTRSRPPQHGLRRRLSPLPRRRSWRRTGILLRAAAARVAPFQRVRARHNSRCGASCS